MKHELGDLAQRVAAWAAEQPRVSAAHIFGSRVKGTNRPDSDLDVAVELLNPWGTEGDFCDWAELADDLRESLQGALPCALDLTQYENPKDTPTVHGALDVSSVCVFQRGAATVYGKHVARLATGAKK